MKISVLGCGRWGSFIAWYLNKNGHDVTSFGIAEDPYVLEFFKTSIASCTKKTDANFFPYICER